MARLVRGTVDEDGVRAALERLGAGFAAREPDAAGLARFLFAEGFQGDADDYYALDNSLIDRVVERRRGIPITLGVIYVHVGRRAGLSVRGINAPGHFLVEADGILIDPFAARLVGEAQPLPGAPADAQAIALRMLNNVRGVLADEDPVAALRISDYQLALVPGTAELHVERARLWQQIGSVESAVAELDLALGRPLPDDLKRKVARWRAMLLDVSGSTLH